MITLLQRGRLSHSPITKALAWHGASQMLAKFKASVSVSV